MTETWRPVVGHEGAYEVSDLGRVRSLDREIPYQMADRYNPGRRLNVIRHAKGHMLQPGIASHGYPTVSLGRGHTRLVHQLVLEAFLGPCPPGMESLHADDDHLNPKLDNLSWGTRSQNLHDAVRNGKAPIGELKWNAKLTDAAVRAIRAELGRTPYVELGRRFGVSESSIRQVRDGKSWAHVKVDGAQ